MNFSGKAIDTETIEKIKKFMNTNEGNMLKDKIKKMSKEDLEKLVEKAQNSNFDLNKIKEALDHKIDKTQK